MPSKQQIVSPKKISQELTAAFKQAHKLMKRNKQRIMSAEILLLAFVTTSSAEAYQILQDFSRERGFNWDDFVRDVDRDAGDRRRVAMDDELYVQVDDNDYALIGDNVVTILDEGIMYAEDQGETACTSAYALAVMANIDMGTHWLLNRRGITERAVKDELSRPNAVAQYNTKRSKNKKATIYHRVDLQDKLINLLSIASHRHVILVGAAGVGKRSLVLSLAQLIAEGKGPARIKSVIEIDERALLDDPAKEVDAALNRARGGILFIPDIARFFGGIRAEFREDAGNALQKGFLSSNVVIIGTATQERFNQKLHNVRVINEHSQVLQVPPTNEDETVEILKTLHPKFESDYNLTITKESLPEVVRLAKRFQASEPLPGSAVHLLHQTCALIKTISQRGDESEVDQDNQLDPDDVLVATSMITGIPVANMGADERDRYLNMVDHLHKRIVGQKEAVLALSRAVKMARVGLKDPKRPIGSFMFLGPTGVGKSELAKALAEFMFGTEDSLITLDMSEYMEDSSVNRLIGSPPGYVGHEAGGQLTDAVKQQPYSVVLFDEVEKASVKVFDVLLQVLDAGRLTSGQGETVSFSECVILMTSNIGSRFLADPELSEIEAREEAEAALKEHFRPEFLNRLDDIIYFHLLTQDNLRDILGLLMKKEEKLMASRDLTLEVTPAAKTWLLEQNEHPEWGARPLRRILQKHIREPMADFLLREDPKAGTTVKVRVKAGELLFETS